MYKFYRHLGSYTSLFCFVLVMLHTLEINMHQDLISDMCYRASLYVVNSLLAGILLPIHINRFFLQWWLILEMITLRIYKILLSHQRLNYIQYTFMSHIYCLLIVWKLRIWYFFFSWLNVPFPNRETLGCYHRTSFPLFLLFQNQWLEWRNVLGEETRGTSSDYLLSLTMEYRAQLILT